MNTMKKAFACFALALALSGVTALQAQTALTQTTASVAIGLTDQVINVASATGITTAGSLMIFDYGTMAGEFVSRVVAVNGTAITVRRDQNPVAHALGAVVVIAPTRAAFVNTDRNGACTAANTGYTPLVNVNTGVQTLCSSVTGTYVRGFSSGFELGATAAVASAAGSITPSGPLFHVTGTAAITGLTLPVGFHGGTVTAIFDGAATWTAAGNISNASLEAMTAGCRVTFTYEVGQAKWYPSTLTCNPTP
jgi:hypothetical protein